MSNCVKTATSDTAQRPTVEKGKRRLRIRQWLARKMFGHSRSTTDLVLKKATGGKMCDPDGNAGSAGDHVLPKEVTKSTSQRTKALCGFKSILRPTQVKNPGSQKPVEGIGLFRGYFDEVLSEGPDDDDSVLVRYSQDAADPDATRPPREFSPILAMMPYNIKALLGYGSQGAVYTVTHAGGEFVAKLARKAMYRAITINEFIIMRELKHPNIAQIVAPIQGGFVMERLHTDLTSLLARDSPDSKTKLSIAAGIVRGLMYIHARAIAHLDIKPSNILLDERSRPKLADFGLSTRFMHPSGKMKLMNEFMGTPTFMPPELMRYLCGGPYRGVAMAPVDIWACGCLTYEMLTGKLPFGDDNEKAIYTRQMSVYINGLEFPTEAMPNIRTDKDAKLLLKVTRKMLELHPAERATAEYMVKKYFGHVK